MDPTPLVVAFMAALGLVQIVWPKKFAGGIRAYVCKSFESVTPDEAERLARVLDARVAAEAGSETYLRLSGAFALCVAASVPLLKIPVLTAFGIGCFGMAVILTLAYGEFRRPTERRAARLARRAPLRSVSPVVLANAAVCGFAALQLLVFPEWRFGVAALLVAGAIVLFLAWRVAAAPARLLGEDPSVESAIDERVRYCRASAIAFCAAVPLYAVVTMTGWYAPHSEYYGALRLVVDAATIVTMWSLAFTMRRPLVIQ
jgi:hypothetical protein